jgi:hypothetical protein
VGRAASHFVLNKQKQLPLVDVVPWEVLAALLKAYFLIPSLESKAGN